MRLKTYTYTAKVSRQTHQRLDEFLWHLTDLYNAALEERQSAYEKGVGKSFMDQCKALTEYRKENNQYLTIAQRTPLKRLDDAFKRFFKGIGGYPKFKSKRNGVKSFEIPGQAMKNRGTNYVYVKDVGSFKFKKPLPDGKLKQVIVKKTPRRIKVFFLMEVENKEQRQDTPIGIDMGILNRITLSNGFQVEKRELDRNKIKELQRKFNKTKKKSNNRKKISAALRKEWQRTTEKEHGYLHELTSDLVNNVSNCFVVEDLNIQGMMKTKPLARSIAEQQWYKFIQLLTYKCEWTGGWVKKVNPKNTSKTCNDCGSIQEISLDKRTYICDNCEYIEDRDVNAAKNILRLGVGPGGNLPGVHEQKGILVNPSI